MRYEKQENDLMAIQQFLATVRSDGALILPREARENLHLKPGEVVLVSLDRSEASRDSQGTPDSFDLTAFFAETDAVERQPSLPTDPQKVHIAAETAEKHRQMGLKIPC